MRLILKMFDLIRTVSLAAAAKVNDHTHEIGQRVGLHFCHDLGAVILYGAGARAQHMTNRFARIPLDEHIHDFALSLGQRSDTFRRLLTPQLIAAGSLLEFREVKPEHTAPGLFGGVHRHVRHPEQGVKIARIAGRRRDASACSDFNFLAFDGERTFDTLKDSVRDNSSLISLINRLQYESKLIAGNPTHGIGVAYAFRESSRNLLKQRIGNSGALTTVDRLEAVKVDQHHGNLPGVALRARHRPFQAVAKIRPVRELSQDVMSREELESPLKPLRTSQIAGNRHDGFLTLNPTLQHGKINRHLGPIQASQVRVSKRCGQRRFQRSHVARKCDTRSRLSNDLIISNRALLWPGRNPRVPRRDSLAHP